MDNVDFYRRKKGGQFEQLSNIACSAVPKVGDVLRQYRSSQTFRVYKIKLENNRFKVYVR